VELSIVSDEAYFTPSIQALGAKRVPRRLRAVLSALGRCDILIQGGGSVFHDSYVGRARLRYWKNLLMWLGVFVLARLRSSKVLLLGAGIGPVEHPVTRVLCRLALSCAHAVMVRDSASLATTRSLGLSNVVDTGFDLAVLLGGELAQRQRKLVIGVAPCSLEPFSEDGTLVAGYWTELAAALGEFALSTGAEVRLFGLFTGYRFSSDEATCRAIADKLPSAVERQLRLYPDTMTNAVAEFAECDVVIAARYHGLLAGFMAGSRLLAVTYNRKVGDLARSMGLAEDCIVAADVLLPREFWLSKLHHLQAGNGQPSRSISDLAERTQTALQQTLSRVWEPDLARECARWND
jgi:polysaccharide pyruvyl transferase WcaK-like protein